MATIGNVVEICERYVQSSSKETLAYYELRDKSLSSFTKKRNSVLREIRDIDNLVMKS